MSAVRAADTVDLGAARRAAQHILSDRRFRPGSSPRPLRGVLRWLGDRLDSIGRPIGRLLSHIPSTVLLVLGVGAVAALGAWIATRIRRRAAIHASPDTSPRLRAGEHEDAAELERAADAAERSGDLERALRLRFRAGLLRLGDRGAIRYRPSVTTGEVRRALGSPRFDDLAGTFEAVTYGGQPADPPAVETARREWPRVLEETGRR